MDGAPEKKAAFLVALRERGVVGYAAKAVGIARRTVYNWRTNDPDFATEWDDAVADAVDAMETEAYRRATEGVEKPVFQQGAQVGIIREYSDLLLIFMLKAKKPKEFRERLSAEFSGPDGGPIESKHSGTDADAPVRLSRVLAILERAGAVGGGSATDPVEPAKPVGPEGSTAE